ncbi:MAG: hypothetical protein GX365_07365 [Clostridiales bacterium]|nr:hypothetical protein [Clostridiales bacterium]
MMKIEILFPEFCNLFGDIGNIKYLKECLPNEQFIETSFQSEPAFVSENIDFIYMGAMTERIQEKVISKLMRHKLRIIDLIEGGTVFLFTGNAIEIVGSYIEDSGRRIECINIFDFYAKRNMMSRYNSLVLGKFKDIDIVGFKTQFTMAYGNNEDNHFIKTCRGIGFNDNCSFEGIVKNNFFGTYLVAPILVLNPLFTKHLFKKMGIESPKIAFEDEVMEAYYKRLEDFRNPKIRI